MGYQFRNGAWIAPSEPLADLSREADRLHALLVERAGEIGGCPDESLEDTEFKAIANALEAYEAKRWPEGRERRGKG
jgi:hypothetical protein